MTRDSKQQFDSLAQLQKHFMEEGHGPVVAHELAEQSRDRLVC